MKNIKNSEINGNESRTSYDDYTEADVFIEAQRAMFIVIAAFLEYRKKTNIPHTTTSYEKYGAAT